MLGPGFIPCPAFQQLKFREMINQNRVNVSVRDPPKPISEESSDSIRIHSFALIAPTGPAKIVNRADAT